jgi:hypothetical protein
LPVCFAAAAPGDQRNQSMAVALEKARAAAGRQELHRAHEVTHPRIHPALMGPTVTPMPPLEVHRGARWCEGNH